MRAGWARRADLRAGLVRRDDRWPRPAGKGRGVFGDHDVAVRGQSRYRRFHHVGPAATPEQGAVSPAKGLVERPCLHAGKSRCQPCLAGPSPPDLAHYPTVGQRGRKPSRRPGANVKC